MQAIGRETPGCCSYAFGDLGADKVYLGVLQYCHMKLVNVLFTRELGFLS